MFLRASLAAWVAAALLVQVWTAGSTAVGVDDTSQALAGIGDLFTSKLAVTDDPGLEKPYHATVGLLLSPPEPRVRGVDYQGAASFKPRQCGETDELCRTSNSILARLFELQYPKQCDDPQRKFLICYPLRSWGFGSAIHHAMWCLTLGYLSNRTVVFKSQGVFNKADDCPVASQRGRWECIFRPPSSCTEPDTSEEDRLKREIWTTWLSEKSDARVIVLDQVFVDQYATWVPPGLENLGNTYQGLNVAAWFKGHLAWFLGRVNPRVRHEIEEIKKQVGFRKPAIGVHVRRTDKVEGQHKEADMVSLDKYMQKVRSYAVSVGMLDPPILKKRPVKSKGVAADQLQAKPPVAAENSGSSDTKSTAADGAAAAEQSTPTSEPNSGSASTTATKTARFASRYRFAEARTQRHLAHDAPPADASASASAGSAGADAAKLVDRMAARIARGLREALNATRPLVFLATDELDVIEEAKREFGHEMDFVTHPQAAKLNTDITNRYTYAGMISMLADVDMLSSCEFFVGTFSSNLSRWVYELMLFYKHAKAISAAVSVDGDYKYDF